MGDTPFHCRRRGWSAILTTALALAVAAPALPAEEDTATLLPSLVVVTVSSLRSDRVQAIGQRGSRTPYLLSLGKRGALLNLARTPVPETVPALASLFTGLDPYLHGVYGDSHPNLRSVTLGDRLLDAGYRGTAWFNAPLGQGMALLERGLAETHEFPDLDATGLADQVLAAEAESLAAGGHFLWVHLGDASAPYRPDLADLLTYRSDGWNDIWEFPLAVSKRVGMLDTLPRAAVNGPMREAAFYMDSYDAAVLKVDRALQTLIEGLLPARLGEHHAWFSHGSTLYEEELQVPVLFLGPDVQPLDQPMGTSWASLIDVMPSLLQLMGLPEGERGPRIAMEEARGFNLAPLLRGFSAPPVRWIPSAQAQAPYARSVLAEGRYKIILSPPRPPMFQGERPWPDVEQIEFHDLQFDPLELTDQSVTRGDLSNRLARHVRLKFPPWPNSPPARDSSRRR